jgi:uncharacterized protein YggE
MYRLLAIALVLSIAVVALSAQAPPAPNVNNESVIVTQGLGSIKLPADRAWVSIGVEARAGKAVDARSRAATQMAAVQAAIRAVGLGADALKTSTFSLQPQMEADDFSDAKKRVREYAVRNEIEVRVDNLDILSEVLDAAGAVKTSGTLSVSIEGLRFDLRTPASAEQDALRMAVEDAMTRAQTMAKGAGRSLGPIVKIEELAVPDPEATLNMARPVKIITRSGTNGRGAGGGGQSVAVDTPVEPNQIEFRALVNLTVAIR